MIPARLLALLAFTALPPLSKSIELDVFTPLITYPTAETIWYTGAPADVQWDISNAPREITNSNGIVYLVRDSRTLIERPLASGFSLLDGKVSFYVPNIEPGPYQVNLMGDSGDKSQIFQIREYPE